MEDISDWSKSKLIKRNILQPHWGTPKAARLITLFSSMAAQRHAAVEYAPILAQFLKHNEGEPRALRALNLIEELNGSPNRWRDGSNDWAHNMPKAEFPN